MDVSTFAEGGNMTFRDLDQREQRMGAAVNFPSLPALLR